MTAEADDFDALLEAQSLIASAIALLDKIGAPPHIAAHLHLVHHHLAGLNDSGETA